MNSRTKPALRVVTAAAVQLSLSMEGEVRDVQHAFHGLCVNAGGQDGEHPPNDPGPIQRRSRRGQVNLRNRHLTVE